MIFNVGVPAKTRILEITPPTVTVGTYTYNGNPQGPTISAYDSNLISVVNGTGVDAGEYTLALVLKNKVSYRWSDGTTDDKTYTYTINKVQTVITTSADSVTVVSGDPVTSTISVSSNSGAELTVTSSNDKIVTATVYDGHLHVNPVTSISGTADLTIVSPESTNGTAATKVISVTVTLTTVTWASGTIQQIAAMLRAHYAGVIDIHDYWSVGDSRTISLNAIDAADYVPAMPAQDITFILVHSGGKICYDIWNEDRSAKKECAFVVGAASCLNTTMELSWISGMRYGYNNTFVENWLADGYRGGKYTNHFWKMFPAGYCDDGDIFKRATWYSETYPQTNSSTSGPRSSSIGLFTLPSEVEIFGTHTYAAPNDTDDDVHAKFTYYTNTSRRIKKLGANGNATRWWLRTIDFDNSSNIAKYATVSTSGGLYSGVVEGYGNSFGICPHGII